MLAPTNNVEPSKTFVGLSATVILLSPNVQDEPLGPKGRVYVRTSVNRFIRTEVRPGAGELIKSGPARRRTEVEKQSGADRSLLLPVSLGPRKRPCKRTVSLRAKRDDREHPIRNAPALIAGQILDLDVAINPGGAIQLT